MSNTALTYLIEHPWLLVLQAIVGACIATGIWTRNRVFRHANEALGTRSIPHTTHWIPWVGNAYASWTNDSLSAKSRECESPVFATTVYGRDYIVLTGSGNIEGLLRDGTVQPNVPDAATISRRFFGNSNITAATTTRKQRMKQIHREDEKKLDAAASLLNTHAYNLISPAQSWVDQAQWERTSGVKVVESEQTLTVSASLNIIIRDFSAYILLCPLLGRSFLEANPGFIGDMFQFGSSYKSFMRGVPYWIMPGLGPPAFAREKCLRALDGLVRAITADQTGRSVAGLGDAVLYDVDEVHKSIVYAVRHAREEDKEKPGIRTVSSELLEFVFEMTNYYVLETLWVIVYLSSRKAESTSDIESYLNEIKQFVKVVKPPPSGLPYEDPPQLKFNNISKLGSELEAKCPVISSTVRDALKCTTQSLVEFRATMGKILSPDTTAEDKPKHKFEIKQGDHILSGIKHAAPGDLAALDKGESKLNLDIGHEERVWILVAVLLSMYKFDSDGGNSSISSISSSSHGFSSITEPYRNMQASISRRAIA